jgi:type II secretory pathway pseudopilin PulG
MSLEPTTYTYDYSAITGITQTDQIIGVGMVVVGIILYIVLPSFYQYLEARALLREKNIKRQAIGDLISMKEIQGEIEKEIRDALIRSELRAKPEALSELSPAQVTPSEGAQK